MEQKHPWVGVTEGTVALRTLSEPVAVEPPRQGEDPTDCNACRRAPDALEVYRDELWRVHLLKDTAFAGTSMLTPLRHADGVPGLDERELASYGPMVARVTTAVGKVVGFRGARTARVHSHLWNDGGAHLHQWFFPRPYGYLEMLGSVLVEWEETLPRATEDELLAAAAVIRAELNR
jgi:diadenosine tetraphosphate (Ap4A) HIT family hydrolase